MVKGEEAALKTKARPEIARVQEHHQEEMERRKTEWKQEAMAYVSEQGRASQTRFQEQEAALDSQFKKQASEIFELRNLLQQQFLESQERQERLVKEFNERLLISHYLPTPCLLILHRSHLYSICR